MTQPEPQPLISNSDLELLLSRAKGMSKTNRDTMHEALVYVRGTYERDRATLTARLQQVIAERDAALAKLERALKWLPEHVLEWDDDESEEQSD